ncbi:MAG TPA: hypothetical protein DIW31_12475 [Bacteroidales bacterium]|nr:hypothetical protein [Bacteroidales bacterium]
MVRLTENRIIVEIPSDTPFEDLNSIQQSILMSIQFMNPSLNPMDRTPNPVFWLSNLLENTLPKLENYNKAYSPDKALLLPEKLNSKQIELLREALFELKSGEKVRKTPNPIVEIIKELE